MHKERKLLGKLFSFLNPAPKREEPKFLDHTAQDTLNAAQQQTPKPAKQEASAIQVLEKKYGHITQQEIKQAGDFLDRKDFRFYDFLLGESKEKREVNDLEKKILIDTNKMLNRPEVALKHLPQLPQSITQLKNMLDNSEFKLEEFSKVVQKEPALASHMVKVANSPMHNQSGKEISNLSHAFMLIGSEGVKEHVLMRFFKQLMSIRPIYFRMFGAKIWDHSLSTAMMAKKIADSVGVNKEAAYLIGLVHDIGKIMIFQLMVNAFKTANPEDSPNSMVFKKLLNDKSMVISLMIVKEWKMPDSVVNAIHDLALTHKRPAKTKMGKVLYDANLVSELVMMHESTKLAPEQYLEMAKQTHLSDVSIDFLFKSIVAEGN